jgi:hypothetical protein
MMVTQTITPAHLSQKYVRTSVSERVGEFGLILFDPNLFDPTWDINKSQTRASTSVPTPPTSMIVPDPS